MLLAALEWTTRPLSHHSRIDSTLKPNMGSYSLENDTKINPNLPESHQQGEEFRNEISEASKMPSDESFQKQRRLKLLN